VRAMGASGGAGARVFRRYPNRRLYDTEQSRYVALEDVEAVVRAGRRVQVVEAKGGRDVTREVLVQLVAGALEQAGDEVVGVEGLHRLVRAARVVVEPRWRAALGWIVDAVLAASGVPAGEGEGSSAGDAGGARERLARLEARVRRLEAREGGGDPEAR
jgi:polyhydroxyalkanoate synthesis repressor PhaR